MQRHALPSSSGGAGLPATGAPHPSPSAPDQAPHDETHQVCAVKLPCKSVVCMKILKRTFNLFIVVAKVVRSMFGLACRQSRLRRLKTVRQETLLHSAVQQMQTSLLQ